MHWVGSFKVGKSLAFVSPKSSIFMKGLEHRRDRDSRETPAFEAIFASYRASQRMDGWVVQEKLIFLQYAFSPIVLVRLSFQKRGNLASDLRTPYILNFSLCKVEAILGRVVQGPKSVKQINAWRCLVVRYHHL